MMVLRLPSATAAIRRLPRTSGDGPQARRAGASHGRVGCRTASMLLWQRWRARRCSRLPSAMRAAYIASCRRWPSSRKAKRLPLPSRCCTAPAGFPRVGPRRRGLTGQPWALSAHERMTAAPTTGPRARSEPAKRGAAPRALTKTQRPASWASRAGGGWGRSSGGDSHLVAHSLRSGCSGARHPFGAGLNPKKSRPSALRSASDPALRWLKCAAVRR